MRNPALMFVTLLIASTLAACGGVDKNAYVENVTKVQQATQKEASALSTKMASAKTPAQVASNLAALGKAVEANATDLAAIQAPEAVAAQHKSYVELMRKFGSDLEALAKKVKNATPTTVPKILTDAQTLTSDLSTGETKIVNEINTELQS